MYKYWVPIQTRWKDNDMYGHVNNTEYYSYFDTVINHFLIKNGGLDPVTSKTIGLCVESKCNFFSALEFPVVIEAGLIVTHKGKSSLKYEIGIFQQGSDIASAHGHFVHVFVDAKSRRPTPYPKEISVAIDQIKV
jgi:acyl-CoA thioester hydrolase